MDALDRGIRGQLGQDGAGRLAARRPGGEDGLSDHGVQGAGRGEEGAHLAQSRRRRDPLPRSGGARGLEQAPVRREPEPTEALCDPMRDGPRRKRGPHQPPATVRRLAQRERRGKQQCEIRAGEPGDHVDGLLAPRERQRLAPSRRQGELRAAHLDVDAVELAAHQDEGLEPARARADRCGRDGTRGQARDRPPAFGVEREERSALGGNQHHTPRRGEAQRTPLGSRPRGDVVNASRRLDAIQTLGGRGQEIAPLEVDEVADAAAAQDPGRPSPGAHAQHSRRVPDGDLARCPVDGEGRAALPSREIRDPVPGNRRGRLRHHGLGGRAIDPESEPEPEESGLKPHDDALHAHPWSKGRATPRRSLALLQRRVCAGRRAVAGDERPARVDARRRRRETQDGAGRPARRPTRESASAQRAAGERSPEPPGTPS